MSKSTLIPRKSCFPSAVYPLQPLKNWEQTWIASSAPTASRDSSQSKACFILEKRKETKKEIAAKCGDQGLFARKREDDHQARHVF